MTHKKQRQLGIVAAREVLVMSASPAAKKRAMMAGKVMT